MIEYCRAKTHLSFMFVTTNKCYVNVQPQQKWKVLYEHNYVCLERNNVNLEIPKKDFEKYFRVVASHEQKQSIENEQLQGND